MSSDIQTTLDILILNNYVSLAIVTAVSYDYILTFSREVSHVICTSVSSLTIYTDRVHLGKELPHYHPDTTLPMFSQYRHWTWVSTMFVVVCTILSGSLYHFFWTDCSDRSVTSVFAGL
ncbi:hypothetical protein EV363DRAFT_285367 [Boletus edulis]|nr:hypothetical protein EV363DRAFT_285367 [Boletus edulis]